MRIMKHGPPSILSRSLTIAEAAYIAGFVDGEGSIPIFATNRTGKNPGVRYRTYLTVGQTDIRPLTWMQSLLGGSIRLDSAQKAATAIRQRKPFYVLKIDGYTLDLALPQIIPFMIVKRDRAELCLEMRKLLSSYSKARRGRGFNALTDYEKVARLDVIQRSRSA